ncbi:MAG: outer membrane protein assembly factor BamD [bacterium]
MLHESAAERWVFTGLYRSLGGRATLAFVLALTPLWGCTAQTKFTGTTVSYSATARQNYRKGMKALKSKAYEDATKYFKFVRAKYPFSKYATLSELRQADTLREEEKFITAIDAYKTFIKEHPTHPMVESGYAAYYIGISYWKLTPGDLFIMPPSEEKDQTSTEAAMVAFKDFLSRFPDSPYKKKAAAHYRKSLRRLAAHEMYVARFYLGRGKPMGAIFRLEYLIRKYPDAGVEPTVMFLLGKTYLRLKKRKKALTIFQSIIKKYPSNFNAKKARRYIAFISREFGLK